MNPSQTRSQTLRQSWSDHTKSSLPSLVRSSTMFFESKKHGWPEPEKSVGRPCELKFRRTECWEVTGPALDLFNRVAPAIDKLLEDNQELLEQGEPKPRGISFNMWMEGSKPSTAQPLIVFSSKSRRQRSYAKALLKESGILHDQPAVSVKALDKMPAVHQAKPLSPSHCSTQESLLNLYMTDPSSEPFGAQISFGNSQLATMLGMVDLNGKPHALVPQHPRFDYRTEELECPATKDELLEFDEDSDFDADEVEITSTASISSSEPSGSDTATAPLSDEDSIFDHSHDPQSTSSARSDPSSNRTPIREPEVLSRPDMETLPLFHEHSSNRLQFATLSSDDTVNDLDYECLPINDSRFEKSNRIMLPTTSDKGPSHLYLQGIASEADESEVWAVTGTTGLVKGTILESPYYIKLNGSRKCQEMWPVRLERDTIPGDCGAWVVNAATGLVYGHIVAGDPMSGMAYIIPAYKVFSDIERRFGARPTLWSAAKDIQPAMCDLTAQIPFSVESMTSYRSRLSGFAAFTLLLNRVLGTGLFAHSGSTDGNPYLITSPSFRLSLYLTAAVSSSLLNTHSAEWSLCLFMATLLFCGASAEEASIQKALKRSWTVQHWPASDLVEPFSTNAKLRLAGKWPPRNNPNIDEVFVRSFLRDVQVEVDFLTLKQGATLAQSGTWRDKDHAYHSLTQLEQLNLRWSTSSLRQHRANVAIALSLALHAVGDPFSLFSIITRHFVTRLLCIWDSHFLCSQHGRYPVWVYPMSLMMSLMTLKIKGMLLSKLGQPSFNSALTRAAYTLKVSRSAESSVAEQILQEQLRSRKTFMELVKHHRADIVLSHQLLKLYGTLNDLTICPWWATRPSGPFHSHVSTKEFRRSQSTALGKIPDIFSIASNQNIDSNLWHLSSVLSELYAFIALDQDLAVNLSLLSQRHVTGTDCFPDWFFTDGIVWTSNDYLTYDDGCPCEVRLPKRAYTRSSYTCRRTKIVCAQCNTRPQGFRGQHELERHIKNTHASFRKVWVCQDSSSDQNCLSGCQKCVQGKKYNAYYNAAAHLRRAHFIPRVKERRSKNYFEKSIEREEPGGGEVRSMDSCKLWIREVHVDISQSTSADDNANRGSTPPKDSRDQVYANQPRIESNYNGIVALLYSNFNI